MSEWISVKERMPPESDILDPKLILVCNDSDGSVFAAFFKEGEFALGNYEFSDITHWMPFPDPPAKPCPACGNADDVTCEECEATTERAKTFRAHDMDGKTA